MAKTGYVVEVPVAKVFDGKLFTIIEKYGKIDNLTKNIGSNANVNKTLRQIFERIGVDPKITFHSSRHTFATLLGQRGVHLTTIQKLLGHQKLQTTEIYNEVDRRMIINDIKKSTK